eukprot:1194327-Prorocentrum_minimum.AAC.2
MAMEEMRFDWVFPGLSLGIISFYGTDWTAGYTKDPPIELLDRPIDGSVGRSDPGDNGTMAAEI